MDVKFNLSVTIKFDQVLQHQWGNKRLNFGASCLEQVFVTWEISRYI
jgi:hypothetical protein